MSETKYKIYMIVNQFNGKFYIGKTKQTLSKRFNYHCYTSKGSRSITRAIKKYGKSNFKIFVIDYANSPSELNIMEINYIKILKARNRSIAYNLSGGGEGGECSDETKQILRDINTGKKYPDSSSKYFGVFIDDRFPRIKWRASGKLNGKYKNLGTFRTEVEAANCYNNFIIQHNLLNPLNVIRSEHLTAELKQSNELKQKSTKGIIFNKQENSYTCKFMHQRTIHKLGTYKTFSEAVNVYNKYIEDNLIDRPLIQK